MRRARHVPGTAPQCTRHGASISSCTRHGRVDGQRPTQPALGAPQQQQAHTLPRWCTCTCSRVTVSVAFLPLGPGGIVTSKSKCDSTSPLPATMCCASSSSSASSAEPHACQVGGDVACESSCRYSVSGQRRCNYQGTGCTGTPHVHAELAEPHLDPRRSIGLVTHAKHEFDLRLLTLRRRHKRRLEVNAVGLSFLKELVFQRVVPTCGHAPPPRLSWHKDRHAGSTHRAGFAREKGRKADSTAPSLPDDTDDW
jgi:hypothetical protein